MMMLFATSLLTYSQQYTSEKLRNIGKKINIKQNKNITPGYHDIGKYRGKTVIMGVTSKKEIFHLGYKLFADNMKIHYPSELYDFLERYFLELDCINKSEELIYQHLIDDKVLIKKGNIFNVNKIAETTPFSIKNIDDVCYEIEWREKDKVLLNLQFPIDYQLLLGLRKSEIELTMQDILQSTITGKLWIENLLAKSPEVEMMSDGYFKSKEHLIYYIEGLNTIEYYERGDKKKYIPVYDDKVMEYSLHNLFRGIIAEDNQYQLNVLQNLYGYKKTSFTVSLSQWINYCKSNGLCAFVGVSRGSEESYKVTVIAQNKKLGYNHLMKVVIPKDFMQKPNAVFATELYAFIPTSNLKDVYQKSNN